MDNLALLCNLYAEGPATLARLRDARCANLEALETMQAEDLAEILEISLSSSRRFLREAQHLVQRVGAVTQGPGEPALTEPTTVSPETSALERVLGAWRAKDKSEPESGVALAAEAPAAPAEEPGTALRPQMLDGLDMEWCVRLHSCGVESLQELAEAESMELSRAMDVGLTRLMRLQFLARRELERLRCAANERDVLWPVPPLPARSDLLDTALARFSPAEAPLAAPAPVLAPDLDSRASDGARGANGATRDEASSAGPFA